MSATAQLALPTALPIEPYALLDLEAIDRGRVYNDLDLDSWQRQAIEEARRMAIAGTYPQAAPA